MEILEAFDLTGSYRAAAALAGCDHRTVARYVRERERGQTPGGATSRRKRIDPHLAKLEEWVERSSGKVRADVVHRKLLALGFEGSERTTRRAVVRAKRAYAAGHRRIYRPWGAGRRRGADRQPRQRWRGDRGRPSPADHSGQPADRSGPRSKVDATTAKVVARICYAELIMVDDIGLLPAGEDEAEALYRLVDAAYERRSLILTSNLHPGRFDTIFPKGLATAAVDRLLHHAHVVVTAGQSKRLADALDGRDVQRLTAGRPAG